MVMLITACEGDARRYNLTLFHFKLGLNQEKEKDIRMQGCVSD